MAVTVKEAGEIVLARVGRQELLDIIWTLRERIKDLEEFLAQNGLCAKCGRNIYICIDSPCET